MIGDLTMITMFMVSGTPIGPLAVIAIAASLTRVAAASSWCDAPAEFEADDSGPRR